MKNRMKTLTIHFEIIILEYSICFSIYIYAICTYYFAFMRDRHIGIERWKIKCLMPDIGQTRNLSSRRCENQFSVSRSLVTKDCKVQNFHENIIFRIFEFNIFNVVTYLYIIIFLEYLVNSYLFILTNSLPLVNLYFFILFLSIIFYFIEDTGIIAIQINCKTIFKFHL